VKDDDDLPVMPGERRVRFGCGLLAGVLAGIGLAARVTGSTIGTVLLVSAVALAVGLAAAWGGDRFWRGLGWW